MHTPPFLLGATGHINLCSKTKNRGPPADKHNGVDYWREGLCWDIHVICSSHSYGGPAADSALALTEHHGLKVGRAEHTTVSQVVGPRGCKREKPQISVHGDRQIWWTNRQELEGRRGPFHYLLSHWSVSNCCTCTASSLPLPAPRPAPGA